MTSEVGQLKYNRVLTMSDAAPLRDEGAAAVDAPDRRDGRVYVYNEELQLAVEVALATGRPLLLLGEPGVGKSSFAAFVARNWKARYYEYVVTARTQANDFLWSYDSVRRLSDAQMRKPGDPPLDDFRYVRPGVLWWGIDRASAFRRGAPETVDVDSSAREPFAEMNEVRLPERAVVLVDEIDKADPDVPNDLLVALGSLEFEVHETGQLVRRPVRHSKEDERPDVSQLLVIITTNEERELPAAFMRRCVVHELRHPGIEALVDIARRHTQQGGGVFEAEAEQLCKEIAKKLAELREEAEALRVRPPGTAEFLDAVRACRGLEIDPTSPTWPEVERVVLRKSRELGASL